MPHVIRWYRRKPQPAERQPDVDSVEEEKKEKIQGVSVAKNATDICKSRNKNKKHKNIET